MADVKFMDLSENDNPATTDSVLIGNSTDGLKRTSVGAIGNLFAVKGLFHFEQFLVSSVADPNATVAFPAHSVKDIKAPDVPGYTFEFWLNSATAGDVYPSYIATPTSKETEVWFDILDANTKAVNILVTAVYVNSTVA